MRYRYVAQEIRKQIEYIQRDLTRLNELADQLDKVDGYTPEIGSNAITQIRNEEKMAISVKEAAKLLGVSYPIVLELTHRDDFPSLKIGNRILINRKKLQEWLDIQSSE